MGKPEVFLTFIMDHSGSMTNDKKLAINNFNEQIISAKKKINNVDTYVTLLEFDNEIKLIFDNKKIKDVEIKEDYWIGGMTALNDAIARGIEITKINMKKSKSDDKSALIVIMTDGHENISEKYAGYEGQEKIKSIIKSLEATNEWTFTFMGADIDVSNVAVAGFGMNANNTIKFSKDKFKKATDITCDSLDVYYAARCSGVKNSVSFYNSDNSILEV